jgi:cellulose synthase/poly-beta-1,6-N-acetylglucosamine synthase-like glycosyltransferase
VIDVLSIGLTLAAVLCALPAAVFALEIASARRPAPGEAPRPAGQRPRVAVLVPAHNEASGTAKTLSSLLPQLRTGDRLLVVADNCSDDTAAIARGCRADVVERRDTSLRGKGYALDFGVTHLRSDPPSIVVLVDADCVMAPGSIDALCAECLVSGRPAQALYLMQAGGTSAGERWAELTWRIKNHARPLGLASWGGPCHLMGSGMAFPWPLISAPSLLATGHLIEDVMVGIDLARAGRAARFVTSALVTSRFPPPGEGSRSQRTRWEHGQLSTLLGQGPRLLWHSLLARDRDGLWLALDLLVPPLSLLVLSLGALLALCLAGAALGAPVGTSLAISGLAIALVIGGTLRAWWLFGRDLVSLGELLAAPLQVVRKLPIYACYLWRRQTEWVRAKREGE